MPPKQRNLRKPKPPDLELPELEDHDGILCLPGAPRWWEKTEETKERLKCPEDESS